MSANDGFGKEAHPLEQLLRDGIVGDEHGVWRGADGSPINESDPRISRASDGAYNQAREQREGASRAEAMSVYNHLRENDPQFEERRQAMKDHHDPAVVAELNSNPISFLEVYQQLNENESAEEADSPRRYQLQTLREELKEHDAEYGPRPTAIRERILRQIAAHHGGR